MAKAASGVAGKVRGGVNGRLDQLAAKEGKRGAQGRPLAHDVGGAQGALAAKRGAGASRGPKGKPGTPAERARLTAERLAAEYPGSPRDLIELDFSSPWELLVATVLSAQTTDVRVNAVTPALFKRFPTVEAMAGADPLEVEQIIKPTGFFRVKSRTLVSLAQALCERFGGVVPASMDELVTLPGVGRKTANVVLSVGFGIPGLPVDTHVKRLSRLLGLTTHTEPEKIEADLTAALPPSEWGAFSLRMILHGRRVCIANRPRCQDCVLADFCPSARLPTGELREPSGTSRRLNHSKSARAVEK
jgi:endonuclease-3